MLRAPVRGCACVTRHVRREGQLLLVHGAAVLHRVFWGGGEAPALACRAVAGHNASQVGVVFFVGHRYAHAVVAAVMWPMLLLQLSCGPCCCCSCYVAHAVVAAVM